jgi:peptide/nickel transport system substrate-binding protein
MRRLTTLGGVALIAVAIALGVAACGGGDEGGGAVKADQEAGGTLGKGTSAQKGGELTVGLAEDPDQLDPTLARTFVGRIVFANMCEKLYDLDANLNIVPQLASALPEISKNGKTVTIKLRDGVKFNDGTQFDAAAVKTSLDRHRTLKESARAPELAAM